MARFREALHAGRVLLMDGALGTELQRAGLRPGECGELWNLTRPERVRAVHQAYADAGAQCLLTNTFQANPTVLARHGRADDLEAINGAALALTRSVAGPDRFVLGDIGPLEEAWQAEPLGRVVRSLRGADGLLLETFSDLHALWAVRYVCAAALESEDMPIVLSLTYRRTAGGVLCTHGGQSPEVYARLARQYGVAALGVNCGRDIGLDDIAAIVRQYRQATDLPLLARPNAGTPVRTGDHWVYPRTPEEMAAGLPDLLTAGATLVGGCCGTTPAHIAAFRPLVDAWNTRHAPQGDWI